MTSKPVAQLLIDLGVDHSHSRPHVSNDNPYSEANFKTLKYCPAFTLAELELELGRERRAASRQSRRARQLPPKLSLERQRQLRRLPLPCFGLGRGPIGVFGDRSKTAQPRESSNTEKLSAAP